MHCCFKNIQVCNKKNKLRVALKNRNVKLIMPFCRKKKQQRENLFNYSQEKIISNQNLIFFQMQRSKVRIMVTVIVLKTKFVVQLDTCNIVIIIIIVLAYLFIHICSGLFTKNIIRFSIIFLNFNTYLNDSFKQKNDK